MTINTVLLKNKLRFRKVKHCYFIGSEMPFGGTFLVTVNWASIMIELLLTVHVLENLQNSSMTWIKILKITGSLTAHPSILLTV